MSVPDEVHMTLQESRDCWKRSCLRAEERLQLLEAQGKALLTGYREEKDLLLKRIELLEAVAEAAYSCFAENPEFFLGLDLRWFDQQYAVREALAKAGYPKDGQGNVK